MMPSTQIDEYLPRVGGEMSDKAKSLDELAAEQGAKCTYSPRDAFDIGKISFKAGYAARDAEVWEFVAAWKEHQRTKFLSDGSNFQADVKLNEIVTRWEQSHGD